MPAVKTRKKAKCRECPAHIRARDIGIMRFVEERNLRRREGVFVRAMLDLLTDALWSGSQTIEVQRTLAHIDAEIFRKERRDWADFMHDIDVILATGADMLCGTKFIQAKALIEARKRYTERGEQSPALPGRCCK